MSHATSDADYTKAEQKFEELLANNRSPKVSELRTSLLAAHARGDAPRKEAVDFVRTRVSGMSHALLAFCDVNRLYAARKGVCCEIRQRSGDDAMEGGGVAAGLGVYATRKILRGEPVTEWDTQGITSSYNCDTECHTYYDPRLIDQDTLTAKSVGEADLANEALSLDFVHSRVYHFPLALRTSPWRLWHFVNDTARCPPSQFDEDDENDKDPVLRHAAYDKYKSSASNANVAAVCTMGFVCRLVSTRDIEAGEEILYHWGSHHWDELRRLRHRGMRVAVVPPSSNDDDDDGGPLDSDDGGPLLDRQAPLDGGAL